MSGWKNFKDDLLKVDAAYPFFTYLFATAILAIFILIHENNKEIYLKELIAAKSETEAQKKELEAKNEDIIASFNYAKHIQYAVLPQEESIYRSIPLSFVFYKPKHIVSGDFFWFHELDRDNYILVCADCTGHGVPGAMMTVIGSSLLNQTVVDNKITQPAEILRTLDSQIYHTLRQHKEHEYYVQDGMDIALLKVNKAAQEFTFTSAKRPAVFIRKHQLQEFKGSKLTLGGMRSGEKKFEEIKMNYREDDIIYFYTDGFTDQFGGPKGKKYSSKKFKETLLEIHKKKMNEQKTELASVFESWKGNHDQVDDVLVMGVKF